MSTSVVPLEIMGELPPSPRTAASTTRERTPLREDQETRIARMAAEIRERRRQQSGASSLAATPSLMNTPRVVDREQIENELEPTDPSSTHASPAPRKVSEEEPSPSASPSSPPQQCEPVAEPPAVHPKLEIPSSPHPAPREAGCPSCTIC